MTERLNFRTMYWYGFCKFVSSVFFRNHLLQERRNTDGIHDYKDVAKLAGGLLQLWRVLQDKSALATTKKKVRQAMETLNYHPNVNARSLASNKTNVIA